MECKNCKCPAVRNGKQPNGKHRYYCKDCKKSFQEYYTYKAYNCDTNRYIYYLTIESVGIRSISRLLRVSKTTVINRIKLMSSKITIPITKERNQYYELDEMRVIVKHKSREAWITYAINRDSKKVIDFIVGRRTKSNLAIISNSVLKLNPKNCLYGSTTCLQITYTIRKTQ
jgi:insertion element IS1 protein InsB